MMIFEVACLLAYENVQGVLSGFFPHLCGRVYMFGGIFPLMWEILRAWRESGRNSVQAGDSLSMRESWKPCLCHCLLQIDTLLLMYQIIYNVLQQSFAKVSPTSFWDTHQILYY